MSINNSWKSIKRNWPLASVIGIILIGTLVGAALIVVLFFFDFDWVSRIVFIPDGRIKDGQTYVGLVSAIIGFPVALAGSIYAIYLARNAEEFAKANIIKEHRCELEDKAVEASNTYMELAQTIFHINDVADEMLEDAYRTIWWLIQDDPEGKRVVSKKQNLDQPISESYFMQEVGIKVSPHIKNLIESFNKLSSILHTINSNKLMQEIWEKSYHSNRDKLIGASIKDNPLFVELLNNKENGLRECLSFFEKSKLASIADALCFNIKHLTPEALLNYILATTLNNIEPIDEKNELGKVISPEQIIKKFYTNLRGASDYTHYLPVRTSTTLITNRNNLLGFLGRLIGSTELPLPKEVGSNEGDYLVQFGYSATVLFDLCRMIPNEHIFEDAFEAHLENYFNQNVSTLNQKVIDEIKVNVSSFVKGLNFNPTSVFPEWFEKGEMGMSAMKKDWDESASIFAPGDKVLVGSDKFARVWVDFETRLDKTPSYFFRRNAFFFEAQNISESIWLDKDYTMAGFNVGMLLGYYSAIGAQQRFNALHYYNVYPGVKHKWEELFDQAFKTGKQLSLLKKIYAENGNEKKWEKATKVCIETFFDFANCKQLSTSDESFKTGAKFYFDILNGPNFLQESSDDGIVLMDIIFIWFEKYLKTLWKGGAEIMGESLLHAHVASSSGMLPVIIYCAMKSTDLDSIFKFRLNKDALCEVIVSLTPSSEPDGAINLFNNVTESITHWCSKSKEDSPKLEVLMLDAYYSQWQEGLREDKVRIQPAIEDS